MSFLIVLSLKSTLLLSAFKKCFCQTFSVYVCPAYLLTLIAAPDKFLINRKLFWHFLKLNGYLQTYEIDSQILLQKDLFCYVDNPGKYRQIGRLVSKGKLFVLFKVQKLIFPIVS